MDVRADFHLDGDPVCRNCYASVVRFREMPAADYAAAVVRAETMVRRLCAARHGVRAAFLLAPAHGAVSTKGSKNLDDSADGGTERRRDVSVLDG
jgi:hypothetical protein